jgi:hypothetical protein
MRADKKYINTMKFLPVEEDNNVKFKNDSKDEKSH